MLKQFHLLMAPAGEISSGNAPEVKSNHQDLYENGDPNETFDNLEYESESSKRTGEEYKETFKEKIKKAKENKKLKAESEEDEDDSEEEEEKPKKKEKKKEEPKEEKKKKSDIDTLSDKEDGLEEKEKPKKKGKDSEDEEESEEDEEEGTPEEEEEKSLDKEKKGKIKVRMNGELYGLEGDSMVRYKVDGEWVEKPLQEVLNKASGVEALDKKFTDYGQKNKELQQREAQVSKRVEVLGKVLDEISGIMKNPERSPFDALEILFEKSGQDVYTAKRRMMESVLEEVEKLQSMSEAEVKAYWLEEKDRLRTKTDEARKKAYEQEQTLTQSVQKLDALRQSLGVSEEQFNNAWDELETQGTLKDYTNEQIVEYASIKPHLDTVQDILQPFEDQIQDTEYEEIVRDFAKQLRAKKLSPEQLKKIAKQEFQDEDLKDLSSRAKTSKPKEKTPEKKSSKREYESFDDFED